MNIGVIGLGKMGGPIARKLKNMACQLVVYDSNPSVMQEFANEGFTLAKNISDLSERSMIIWIMVSQKVVDTVLDELCGCTKEGTIVIDGGNSFYKESFRRARELEAKNLDFLDCGTSGGLWGAEHGFSMTIGGKEEVFIKAEFVFKLLASSSHSYFLVGPSGAGHYVKMVHNGIEYALLESYAEGLNLLRHGEYDLDLAEITKNWMSGSIIRSWVLQLTHDILAKDQRLFSIKGSIGENGTGAWTVKEAQEKNIPVPAIKESVEVRAWSRETGGDFRTKLIACIRHSMGGHPVAQEHCDKCQEVR